MKIEFEVNIEPLEGEEFRFLNTNAIKSHTIPPHRYYISNKYRIFDLTREELLKVTNGRVNIVCTNGRRMNISVEGLLVSTFPDQFNKSNKRRKFVEPSKEDIDKMVKLFVFDNVSIPEIAKRFELSEFRVRTYLDDNYDKMRSLCIAKHGNYELSLKFMEALDNIPQTAFKESSMYSVLKSIAEDELGFKFDKNLYHKAYAYITGRSSFLVVTEESSTTSPKGRRSKQIEMESPSDKEGEDIV